LVDKESYLLELCRYVVLNPVRAKVVKRPEEWAWSSYRGTVGRTRAPSWLAVDKVLSFFSGRRTAYRNFVAEGIAKPSVWESLKGQIYLGGEDFLRRVERLVKGKAVQGIARAQLRPLRPGAEEIVGRVGRAFGIPPSRVLDRSHAEAYWSAVYLLRRVGNLSLKDVAGRIGVSPARISQIQAKIEQEHVSERVVQLRKQYKLKP